MAAAPHVFFKFRIVQAPQRPSGTFALAGTLPEKRWALRCRDSYDESVHQRYPVGDPSKRAFTYFVLTGGRMIYAGAIRLAVLKFVLSMSATKDVLALASLEMDLSKIEPGQTVTVKWRGKPVFVRRRTPAEIAKEEAVPVSSLRDQQARRNPDATPFDAQWGPPGRGLRTSQRTAGPTELRRRDQADSERAIRPEWLIVVGVCTHLGCVPLPGAGDFGGWFCPCHGSHYDASGRIRKARPPAISDHFVPKSFCLSLPLKCMRCRCRARRRTTWKCRNIASLTTPRY